MTVQQLFSLCFCNLSRRTLGRHRCSLTIDAFFSVNDLLSNPPLEYDFTASWNTSRKREFWRLMFKGLSPREFRVVHAGPFIASAFKDAADLAVITTAVELPTNNQRAEADDEGESMSSTSDEARSEEDTPEPYSVLFLLPSSWIIVCGRNSSKSVEVLLVRSRHPLPS